MLLSSSGKVVIIDNELESDALPLMISLGKKGIPYTYFTGDNKQLPKEPLKGIRFVFLDIELIPGMTGKNLSSTCAGILRTVISKENGPYVIIFWSEHTEAINDILEYCKTVDISPVAYLNMDKSECLHQNDTDTIDYISKKIEEILNDFGSLNFFIEWENIVNKSLNSFINSITKTEDIKDSQRGKVENYKPLKEGTEISTVAIDYTWEERLLSMFSKLFNSYSEEGDNFSNKEKMSSLYHMINRSFIDTIHQHCNEATTEISFLNKNRICKDFFNRICVGVEDYENFDSSKMKKLTSMYDEDGDFYELKPDLSNTNLNKVNNTFNFILSSIIGFNSIAMLNSALFLNFTQHQSLSTGNIYTSLKKVSIKKKLCESMGLEERKCSIVSILLTPSCDIAQKKAITHRLVYGIMSDSECKKDSGSSLFKIGPYWNSRSAKKQYLTISFQSIHILTIEEVNELIFLFSIKRDLLFDLQSKAANNVNKLGNFQISF